MTDCGEAMLEYAELLRGNRPVVTAQIIQLDAFRKTPRRAVAHEIAMGRAPRLADEVNAIAAGQVTARDLRERNLEFEKWKKAFLSECATRKD